MTREQFEHGLRAVTGITGDEELIVIGSQCVHGWGDDLPEELTMSQEIDIYAPKSQARDEMTSEMITGALGPGSLFETTHGFAVDGVSPTTAKLPENWHERTIRAHSANTGGATGFCLEPHDLTIAKLYAGRDKDHRFIESLCRYGMIKARTLEERLGKTQLNETDRQRMRQQVGVYFEKATRDQALGRKLRRLEATKDSILGRVDEKGNIAVQVKTQGNRMAQAGTAEDGTALAMGMYWAGLLNRRDVREYKRTLEREREVAKAQARAKQQA